MVALSKIIQSLIITSNALQTDLIKLETQKTVQTTQLTQLVDTIQKTRQKTKEGVIQKLSNDQITEQKLRQRKIIPKPFLPKKPKKGTKSKKTPPKKIKIPIPKFGISSRSKNTRQGYLIVIKKGNQVIGFTKTPLPEKRAKNFARKFTDNTIGASHTITKKGKTNIKDVKTLILGKKFRAKKSNLKKVQAEVEKARFRLDKAKEKKQIKDSVKKKVKRVVKVSSKAKKSSKNKPKRTRTTKKNSKKK